MGLVHMTALSAWAMGKGVLNIYIEETKRKAEAAKGLSNCR